jgi:rfaE bifunctional protein kinase chain/domain
VSREQRDSAGRFPDREHMLALIGEFAHQRVVVVGDMVADEYIYGRPTRISREAPVLILEFSRRRMVPGGATNVAVNLRALGAEVEVVGVIGDDLIGRELSVVLEQLGVGTAGLIVDPERPTSTKTRIMGGGSQIVQQQIVRIDRLSRDILPTGPREHLLAAAAAALKGASGLILSDYEHGVIAPEVIARCLPLAAAAGMVTTVDAHGDLYRFQGITLATPNQPEAEAMVGYLLNSREALHRGGRALLEGMSAQGLLITRSSEGMAAIGGDGLFAELPAYNIAEVSDVTGAGDTVAAVATLTLCAGGTLYEAALAGNVAAGLVVRRLGAATTSSSELADALSGYMLPPFSPEN